MAASGVSLQNQFEFLYFKYLESTDGRFKGSSQQDRLIGEVRMAKQDRTQSHFHVVQEILLEYNTILRKCHHRMS